jgi:hypothetical protein
MDKKNVQKSICQNLFAQKRAALGDLRNFLGSNNFAPLWCDNIEALQLLQNHVERK